MSRLGPTARLAAPLLAATLLAPGCRRDAARSPSADAAGPRPEDTVNRFFDAASRGDEKTFLQLVTGPLRTTLLDTRKQLGRKAFRESLQQTTTGIKGLAVTRGRDAPAGQVAIDVEIVFADRIERQRMLLVRQANGWAITAIEEARMTKPPIPYGTPVFEEPLQTGSETPPTE